MLSSCSHALSDARIVISYVRRRHLFALSMDMHETKAKKRNTGHQACSNLLNPKLRNSETKNINATSESPYNQNIQTFNLASPVYKKRLEFVSFEAQKPVKLTLLYTAGRKLSTPGPLQLSF